MSLATANKKEKISREAEEEREVPLVPEMTAPEQETEDRLSWYSRRLEQLKPADCEEYKKNLDALLQELEDLIALFHKQNIEPTDSKPIEPSQNKELEPMPEIDESYRQHLLSFLSEARAWQQEYGPAIYKSRSFLNGEESRKQYKFLAEQGRVHIGFFDLLTKSGRARLVSFAPEVKTWTTVNQENFSFRVRGEDKKISELTPLNLAAEKKDPNQRKIFYLEQEHEKTIEEQEQARKQWRELIESHHNKITELENKITKLQNNPPKDFETYLQELADFRKELQQNQDQDSSAFDDFLRQPVLAKINTLRNLGWPRIYSLETDKIIFNDDKYPGINLGEEDYFNDKKIFHDKKINLNESRNSVARRITADYQEIFSRIEIKKFFQEHLRDVSSVLKKEFKRDAWCLLWQKEQLAKFEDLLNRGQAAGLIENSEYFFSGIEKSREAYLDNCEMLSGTVLIHNSNSIFLEEAIRSGRISNPTGSQEIYGQSPRTNEGSPNDGIFFVAVYPENLKKGAHWLDYSGPKKTSKFPDKMLAHRGYKRNEWWSPRRGWDENTDLGSTKTCGLMIGIQDLLESAVCPQEPFLSQGDKSFDGFLDNVKNGEEILEEGFKGKAIALVPELKMHRQFGTWRSLPLHIDLTQTPEHHCPAIFYFPESERIKFWKKRALKYFQKPLAEMNQAEREEHEKFFGGQVSREEYEKSFESRYDFEKCAKEAGWGINENNEFNQDLFDRQVEENCIFYPDDVDPAEVYPWIVAIAADKIRKYHQGGRRGLYFTYGPKEDFNPDEYSGQDMQNYSYRIAGIQMDKMTWLPLE